MNNDLTLSPIIQGFWRLVSWDWTTPQLSAFLGQCLDLGVTTFDVAEIYSAGEVETQLGRALKDFRREDVQLVSKTGIVRNADHYYDTRHDHIVEACKASLRRLGTDYLDLYLIHRPDPCTDPWEVARAMDDLLSEGLIRAAGVSNFNPAQFNALNTAMGGRLFTNQIEVSPLQFEHFHSGMIDLMCQLRVRPMVYSPAAGGRLFTDDDPAAVSVRACLEEIAQAHHTTPETIVYAWLLYHPVGFLPICGSSKIERVKAAVAALDVKLDHPEWYHLYLASGENILK